MKTRKVNKHVQDAVKMLTATQGPTKNTFNGVNRKQRRASKRKRTTGALIVELKALHKSYVEYLANISQGIAEDPEKLAELKPALDLITGHLAEVVEVQDFVEQYKQNPPRELLATRVNKLVKTYKDLMARVKPFFIDMGGL